MGCGCGSSNGNYKKIEEGTKNTVEIKKTVVPLKNTTKPTPIYTKGE